MASLHQINEFLFRPKGGAVVVDVLRPVSVVAVIDVGHVRADPDGVEAEVLSKQKTLFYCCTYVRVD